MPLWPASSTSIRFGPFDVDPKSGELRKRGVRVKLQEQPLQVLQVLLEQPGQLVTREQLRQRLWPADTFVDFDHGLYNAIKRLREALGDTAETPRFIETVPKRGYRFIAPLAEDHGVMRRQAAAGIGAGNTESASAAAVPLKHVSNRRRRVALLAGAGSLAAVIVALLVGFKVSGFHGQLWASNKPPLIHSVAVLPLKNLSEDPAQEYFSYGMTEELITDLAQVSGLKVISHTSVIQYAKSSKPLSQIARELGVDGIVEGTVQRSGGRVRITAQLIYAPEEQHLWAATYDRDLQDVLALQSSVAAAIVEPIRARTASVENVVRKHPYSPSLQALEDYLQGNYAVERMASGAGYDGYKDAISYYKRAISEDPNFAPAYMKLTEIYDAAYEWRPDQTMPLEHAAIAKALELDPELADAHLMNAQLKMTYDCDLSGAEKELEEAIHLNPNSADAHDSYSLYLANVGRHEEGTREARLAQALDPGGIHGLGMLIASGQYDRVIALNLRHLELHPDNGFDYIGADGLINAYYLAGKSRESTEALQRAWTLFGFKDIGDGVGKAYATSGYARAFRYSARQMERLYAERKVYKPDMIAAWYAMAGDKEQPLKWIGIYLSDNNYCWLGLDHDPDFAFLHSDPRFQELVKRAHGGKLKPASF